LPADEEHRAFGAERVGDAGYRIGRPGSGRYDGAAHAAGHTRVPVGRVRGNLLVPHVDDLDALIDAAVIDVDDVPAAEREDRIDTLVLQRLGDEVTARDFLGSGCRGGWKIFGGRERLSHSDLSLRRGRAVSML
jgi:hypothetical protein